MSGRITPRVAVASARLGDELGLALPVADGAADAMPDGAPPWRLERGADGLALVRPDGVRLTADFASGRARGRATESALASQPLARALGIARLAAALGEPPWLVDATAGLGVDGWQAAALGARVTMLEREPVVHALLADALRRAGVSDEERVRRVAARVTLERADAVAWLEARASVGTEGMAAARPALVYLDPMYPAARRRGRSRKGIEFLHELAGPDRDNAALLDAALAAATHRVIVKRPTGAPPLTGGRGIAVQPISAPNTRYDRYVVAS